ncbi:MAG: M6 family metalloprotease domain-containing protein, partial [bacterium]
MLFSKATYPTGSLRDYYSEVSNNHIDVQGDVASAWVRASQPSTYYTNSQFGSGAYPKNAQKLVAEAVLAANPYVDFSQYDMDRDGVVDILFVVHAGSGNERTGNTNEFRSHAWGLGKYSVKVDGVTVDSYTLEPEDGSIGVFCHELGHVFGLPDLYDDTNKSKGVGDWSLMGSGAWCGPGHDGTSPSHLDAWCKTKLKWTIPITPTKNQTNVSIPQEVAPLAAEGDNTCYKLWTYGQANKEYFLIENRRKTGFDSYLPGQGLLIYHVNEQNIKPTNKAPYFIAIEQADGNMDLEKNKNAGDEGDPWPGASNKNAFDNTSSPNSKDSRSLITHVAVTKISSIEGNITADLSVEPAGTTATGLSISGFVLDVSKKGVEG